MHDPRTPESLLTPVTIHVWAILSDGSCGCGASGCTLAGKHPKPFGGYQDGGGYAIRTGAAGATGSGFFVVDCDEKAGVSGLANFRDLCLAHGGQDIPTTLIVGTGGGGFHFYFRHPGFPVRNSASKLAKGVDIRGDGGIVIGPGSPHRSGRPYQVLHSAPIADAPGWLLDWPGLRGMLPTPGSDAAGPVLEVTPIDATSEEGQRRIDAYRAECAGEVGRLAPSISGAGGHSALYHAAKRGTCYYLLPIEVAAAVLSEYYNPRCAPPWEESELIRKCREAVRTNREITAGPPPEGWGDALIRKAIAGGTYDLDPLDTDGAIEPRRPDAAHRYSVIVGGSIASGKLYPRPDSEIVFRLCRTPEWTGVLQWDEFKDVVQAVNPPVKLDCETPGVGLTDRDVTAVKVWLECAQETKAMDGQVRACVTAAAKACRIHPIRDYLLGLPAGDPGIFTGLAARWFGAQEDICDELLKRFLVSAVRRVLRPGTQVDSMLVLYGPNQGEGKSQWIRSLFGVDWSIRQMPDLTRGADASAQIATTWAVEFGELDKLLKVEPSTVKDFLSREVDTYRKAYGRDVLTKPRQCVFVGTTNEREHLKDPTGERRYWPIWVRRDVDQATVRAERDAVWAAAVALAMDDGVEHWISPRSTIGVELAEYQQSFTHFDSWHETIKDYCAGREYVRGADVFRVAIMRGDPDWLQKWDNRMQSRVASVLRQLGGQSRTIREAGEVIRIVQLPTRLRDASPSPAEVRRRAQVEGVGLKLATGGK